MIFPSGSMVYDLKTHIFVIVLFQRKKRTCVSKYQKLLTFNDKNAILGSHKSKCHKMMEH